MALIVESKLHVFAQFGFVDLEWDLEQNLEYDLEWNLE
jgi:hypothetical protein